MRFVRISVIVFAILLSAVSCDFRNGGCAFVANPDVKCRVLDRRASTELVEYFNVDTNDLRLFLKSDGESVEITHPFGKVTNFDPKIDSNVIKFDKNDSGFLIVNGERFQVERKAK